jgi:hypothetical protein
MHALTRVMRWAFEVTMVIMRKTLSSLALLGLWGCSEVRVNEAPVATPERVVVQTERSTPPEGGDGPSVVTLAHESAEGTHPIPGEALGGVAFQGGALVLRPDGALEMVRGETRNVIDQGVIVAPVVSSDGTHAAWVASRPLDEQALIVVDTEGGRVEAATGLVSIGAIAFEETRSHRRIAFVGGVNGGIAGVWVSSVDGSMRQRCLTNCLLRTGMDLGEMTPLPETPIQFEGDSVRWLAAGQTHSFQLTSGAP